MPGPTIPHKCFQFTSLAPFSLPQKTQSKYLNLELNMLRNLVQMEFCLCSCRDHLFYRHCHHLSAYPVSSMPLLWLGVGFSMVYFCLLFHTALRNSFLCYVNHTNHPTGSLNLAPLFIFFHMSLLNFWKHTSQRQCP